MLPLGKHERIVFKGFGWPHDAINIMSGGLLGFQTEIYNTHDSKGVPRIKTRIIRMTRMPKKTTS